MSDTPVPVSSAQTKELASCNKRESYKSGYMATSYEAIQALPELQVQDLVGVGLIARRCKQARLSREATQAVDQYDASVPQHQSKTASNWVSNQQPTRTIVQDTPNIRGIGPTTQHEICIKPTAIYSGNQHRSRSERDWAHG